MTKPFLLINILLFCNFLNVSAQVIVSSKGGDTAHASAQLEVRSQTKGFLPPVLSTAERKAIQNPAEGLMVFDSSKQKLFVFTRIGWQSFNLSMESLATSGGSSFPDPGFSNNEYAGYRVEVYSDYAYLGAWASNVSGKSEQGAVYMYKFENGTWNYKRKIIAPDGQAGDQFGGSVSATDSFVFIAAPGDSYSENINQGSVYIYKWVDTSLVFQNKLTGNSATSGDRFGYDIKAKNKLLVVGAAKDDIGVNSDQGSVYFFELEGNNWVEKTKYFATTNVANNSLMGYGISIDSNYVAVGCDYMNISGQYGFNRNRISIFKRSDGGFWEIDSEIINPSGSNFESFGFSVTLKENILTVSAPLRDGTGSNKDRGVVYVYKRNGISWGLIQTISPTDSSQNDTFGDYFGTNTAIDGNFLLVGSHYEDFGNGQNDYGGVFVYEWNGNQFVPISKLRSPMPQVYEFFGISVAIHNGKIVVGAPGKSNQSGGAYFYFIE